MGGGFGAAFGTGFATAAGGCRQNRRHTGRWRQVQHPPHGKVLLHLAAACIGELLPIRVAALRRRAGHGAAWVEGAQRLPVVQVGGGRPLLLAGRQTLAARPPSPQGPPGPCGAGSRVCPGSTRPGCGHDQRCYAWGPAGPFTSAQARSGALALRAGARPAGAQEASQSATSSGARGSAAVSSMGSTGASASGSGAARSAAVSSVTRPATTPSTGGRRRSECHCAQGSSYPPPAPGAGGPPPSGDQDPAGDPDPAAQP